MFLSFLLFTVGTATKVALPYAKTENRLAKIRNKMVSSDIMNSAYYPKSEIRKTLPDEVALFTSPKESFEITLLHGQSLADVNRQRVRSPFMHADGCMQWVTKYFVDFRYPKSAVLCLRSDNQPDGSHKLIHSFSYLQLLKGKKIAVTPVFLSAPVSLDGRETRFMVVKKHGPSLHDFMELNNRFSAISLAIVVKITIKLVHTLEKLHKLGISHGQVDKDSVVFRKRMSIGKGIVLTNFENAKSNPLGVHSEAVTDVRGAFSLMGVMNRLFFCILDDNCDATKINREVHEGVKRFHLLTHGIERSSEIDYYEIHKVLKQIYDYLIRA